MSKYKKNLTNRFLYRQFSNSVSEMFDYTMSNLMDGFYDGAMNSAIDGTFKAVCLSGIKTEDNKGSGTDANDAVISNVYINLIVRPLADFGNIMPDPRNSTDPREINEIISMHGSTFLARSDDTFDITKGVSFGQVIDCYFEKGSIINSDFRTLRFVQPKGKDMERSFQALETISGVTSVMDADWQSAFQLGEAIDLGAFPPREATYIGSNASYKDQIVQNGKMPSDLLGKTTLGGPTKPTMLAEIVHGYDAMATAFAARFPGLQLGAYGYRTYERQLSIKVEKPNLAAKPGTSNHGWGMAIDMHYYDTSNERKALSYSGARFKWLEVNAPLSGWFHPNWAKQNGPNKKSKSKKEEPWHWEWKNKKSIIKRNK
jgi:hypothetical protein